MSLELQHLPATRLAYLRWTGPYADPGIPATWERFAQWCDSQGLMQPRRRMYGIAQDDPSNTPPAQCRYDCCVEVDDGFQAQGEIGIQPFAGGLHACHRFTGTAAQIGDAWQALFGQWLPASGWQHAPGPGVELYDTDYVMDPATGVFTCWLCVPVQAR